MMQETIILNSKLMIPKSSSTLTRERLIPLMESVTEKKLTLVVAGAGFGKTTFVSQAVSCLGTEAVWYRLDESDVDFLTFTAYLMQGIRNRFPDRPELFQGVSGIPTSKKSRETYLLRFLSELESGVSEECVIVLDDYYLVQESKEICDAVEYLIERLPENIHLVIISRKPTGLRISKLRVMRDVSDIGEHDLEFSVSEINELYTNLLGIPVTGSTVSGLYEKTGGWAAGLVLISDILKRGDNDDFHRILAGLNRSDTHLFQYLEETMFESQPPDIQEFMLKTSLFSSMDARHCDRLLGIENSADILESLQENHLLTFSYDDDRNRFYYHHLLQEFLRDKLKRTCSRDEVRELYRSIADLLREAGDDYGSLKCFIEGDFYQESVRLFETMGLRLLVEGRFRFIGKCLERMPDTIIDENPQFLYFEGRMCSLSGNPGKAIEKLEKALVGFRGKGDEENSVLCQTDLWLNYYYTGNIKSAQAQLKELFQSKKEGSLVYMEVVTMLIFFASVLGDPDEADFYYDEANRMIRAFQGDEAELARAIADLGYTYRLYVSGDLSASQAMMLQCLDIITRMNAIMLMPLSYFQLAANDCILGRFEEGCRYAETGIRITEEHGIYDSQAAWLHYSWAQNALAAGDVADAETHIRQSLSMFERHGNSWGEANAHDLMHRVCVKQGGRLDEALLHIKTGLKRIDGLGLSITEGILETSLAGIYLDMNSVSDVPDLITSAQQKLKMTHYELFRLTLVRVRYLIRSGNTFRGYVLLKEALALAMNNQYCLFTFNEETWLLPLLTEFDSDVVLKTWILRQIDNAGPHVIAMWETATSDTGQGSPDARSGEQSDSLTVRLFGRFSVRLGNRQILPEEWRSSKALMIFKYLAAKSGQGFVHRDTLIEILWPDEDPEKTGKRFNVAMSTLRKLLEPDLKSKKPSAYINRQKESYQLNTGHHGTIDSDQFLTEIRNGKAIETTEPEASAEYYRKAVSLYTGPFLEEDAYEEWCIDFREMFQEHYLDSLIRLMDHYELKQEISTCIDYALQYLNTDRYTEEIYRKLMVWYSAAGNRTAVIKIFDQCRFHIEETLECPLSEEVVSLYHTLIESFKQHSTPDS